MNCQFIRTQKFQEFIKFCFVGLLCTGIDAFIFFLLKKKIPYQISLIISYIISFIVNYLLTTYWTFSSKPNAKNVFGMIAAHLINCFIIREFLMFLFLEYLVLTDILSYALMLIISVPLNFLMVKYSYSL